jgi:hypothetical protein
MNPSHFGEKLMDVNDLNRILTAALQRGNKQWNTPSGAILDVLRDFIAESKIDEVAEACRLYQTLYPEAIFFVAGSLPALIVNNYKPISEAIDFNGFIAWSEKNRGWNDEISGNAMSPRLAYIVDELVENLRNYKKLR